MYPRMGREGQQGANTLLDDFFGHESRCPQAANGCVDKPCRGWPCRERRRRHNTMGVLSHSARTVRPLSGVSGDFTQWRGPQQTTLAGAPICLWMVTKGLWVICGVSFCFAGLFLLLPSGSNGVHTPKCP